MNHIPYLTVVLGSSTNEMTGPQITLNPAYLLTTLLNPIPLYNNTKPTDHKVPQMPIDVDIATETFKSDNDGIIADHPMLYLVSLWDRGDSIEMNQLLVDQQVGNANEEKVHTNKPPCEPNNNL